MEKPEGPNWRWKVISSPKVSWEHTLLSHLASGKLVCAGEVAVQWSCGISCQLMVCI